MGSLWFPLVPAIKSEANAPVESLEFVALNPNQSVLSTLDQLTNPVPRPV